MYISDGPVSLNGMEPPSKQLVPEILLVLDSLRFSGVPPVANWRMISYATKAGVLCKFIKYASWGGIFYS
jgi:hypothetical protein